MKQISVNANAKINLTLNILNKRIDGYHNIESIMQSVSLFDIVTVSLTSDNNIFVETDNAELQDSEQNIAVYAAKHFFSHNNILQTGVCIKINKKIPIAAGLAGGSADAAAVLVALNILCDTGLIPQKLMEIGARVGADVPFCIMGGTALAQGIGEQLTQLENVPECYIVIVKSGQKASTANAYSKFDELRKSFTCDTQNMINAINQKNIIEISSKLYNAFEEVEKENSIELIKSKLIAWGALGACLSGSGPSIFGIFNDKVKAENCADKLNLEFNQVFLCKTVKNCCIITQKL
jgi:4-diphosphocytidyl-2-C-methyl-D-erythritol kinase